MNKIEEYKRYLNNLVTRTEETFAYKTDGFKEDLINELEFEFQREKILPLLTNKDKIEEIAEEHYYQGYKRFSGDILERNNPHLDVLEQFNENYTMISKLILEHHQLNINNIKFLGDSEQLNPFYSTIDTMSSEIFRLLKKEHEDNIMFKAKEYIIKRIIKEVVDREIVKTNTNSKNEIFNYSSREFNQIHGDIKKLASPNDIINEEILQKNEDLEYKDSLKTLDTSVFDEPNHKNLTFEEIMQTYEFKTLDPSLLDLPKTR